MHINSFSFLAMLRGIRWQFVTNVAGHTLAVCDQCCRATYLSHLQGSSSRKLDCLGVEERTYVLYRKSVNIYHYTSRNIQ
jgi:hypothetical protein